MTQDIHITGAGHTKFGRLPDSLEDLIVESAREAMEEAQTAPSQIDAVSVTPRCRPMTMATMSGWIE